jgi:signal transduction histidine kinase
MISLRNRLALTYGAFICATVILLGVVINRFADRLFSGFVAGNVNLISGHIASSIEDLYNPMMDGFDVPSVEALGMYFVHEGYIVSVTDSGGEIVWDARSCDMEQCVSVIGNIARRMEEYSALRSAFGVLRSKTQAGEGGLSGGLSRAVYPISYHDRDVGLVSIETYSPYFYSEREALFLRTLNHFLVAAGIVFVLLSVVVSVFVATALSRPILKAIGAAKAIASGNLAVRVSDRQDTRELRGLSRTVNDLAAALENGERWQKKLSADIAHELRTPLTSLQGNIEAMIDGVWEPTAERLASCHEEIRRLAKLVEDMSRLSILERDTLILRRNGFDLARLLTSAVESSSQAAAEKGLELRLDLSAAPLPIEADYDRLMQVFINIISNAVKYSDEGSITVRVVLIDGTAPDVPSSGVALGGCRYEVSISDTGIGIPQADLERVFDRFYRTDVSRSRGTGGSGIGLSIARTIVAAHGGSVRAESGIQGTVFRVFI